MTRMLDFDKEEFLKRLDIRLATLTSALSYHEKIVASTVLKRDQYLAFEHSIDRACADFMKYIEETDKYVRDEFAEIRKEMQDMATPNQHKHIKVMMKSDLGPEVPVIMYSDVFAQSAFDHEVTLEEFKMSLDSFSQSSRSSLPQIQAWRDETTEIFFKLLEESGRVVWKSAEFLGGSDYEEVNGTTPDNENKNT